MSDHERENWLSGFLASAPGKDDWPALRDEAVEKFAGRNEEDQLEIALKLASHAGQEAENINRLYRSGKASLPALAALGRAIAETGGDIDPLDLAAMEEWTALCEDEEGECDPSEFFSLPEPIRSATIEHLVSWLRADLLSKLSEGAPDKENKKALKKAVHRAKSAGAVLDASVAPIFKAQDRDEFLDEAYLSPPDPTGAFFIYMYRTVFGKNKLHIVLLGDRMGVIRFEAYQVPLPRFQRIIESTRNNPFAVLVKSDPAFGRWLIKSSEAAGHKEGLPQDKNYLASRRSMGIAEADEVKNPILDKFDEDDLKKEAGAVAGSGQLIEHRVFLDWRFAPPDLGLLLTELKNLKESPLELSPAQQVEREKEMFQKEAAHVIDITGGKKTWKDRMLLAAYVLDLLGDADKAKIAAAVAVAVGEPDAPAPPFFVELLRRTVAIETGEPGDEGPKGPDIGRGGLVVT